MTLPNSKLDREQAKFEEVHGTTHVRVKPDDGGGYFNEFSSNAPLGIGGVFESALVDCDGFSNVKSEVFSDKNGIFRAEWYNDNNVLVRTFDLAYEANGQMAYAAAPTFARFLKIYFTNTSGDAQGVLHIRTRLTNVPPTGQILRIDQDLPGNIVAQTTRSIIAGLNEDGLYQNATVNDVGALNVSSFLLDVSMGRYPSYTPNVKFGRNPSVSANTDPEDIWEGGGIYQGLPRTGSAETLSIVSSSANDSSTGTGARIIRLFGLDGNYLAQTEDIAINGITPVTTTKTWWRMERAIVLTAGASRINEGTITIRHSVTVANIFAQMTIGSNQTSMAISTVPANRVRVITNLFSSMSRANGAAGSANHALLVREFGSVFRKIRDTEVSNSLPYNPSMALGIVLPARTDIKWQAVAVSDNNTVSTAEFEYIDIEV